MKKRILIAALLAVTLTTAGVFAADGSSDTVGVHIDEDGNEINTAKFNAKNEATAGDASLTPGFSGAKGEEYEFAGWATTKEKADAGRTDFSADPTDLTNTDLSAVGAGETKTVYAAYKVKKATRYLVQAYGIGQDDDENGNRMGITFGPAWSSGTKSPVRHEVDGDTSYQYQGEDDTSHHNVITGDDAGTTSADKDLGTEGGNAYRCLYYDNWKTIIYWNQKDPHVYDKCITKGCMRNLRLVNPGSDVQVNNWNGAEGGRNYITIQGLSWGPEVENYAQSYVRAYMNGSDSESSRTVSADDCLLHAFPEELQKAIGKKAVKYAPDSKTTLTSKTVYDKLWLLSNHEIFGNSLRYDTDFAYSEGTAYSVERPAQGGPQTNVKDLSLETGQYKTFADHDVMVTKKDYDYTNSDGNTITAAVLSADDLENAGTINTRSLSGEGYSKVLFGKKRLTGSYQADALQFYNVSPCFTLSRAE